MASAYGEGCSLAQVAQPHLDRLNKAVKWPTEILVPDGLSMVREQTSKQFAAISLRKFQQKRFPT